MAKKKPSKLEKAKQSSGMNAKRPTTDKSFGMKNKKGAKAQGQIAIMNAGNAQQEMENAMRRKAKADAEKKAIADRKMMGGAYKDLSKKEKADIRLKKKVERAKLEATESGKRNMFADSRDAEKEEDTMDQWDQEKLESVVNKKKKNQRTTTEIICKHFLQAVEGGVYGWFWNCPTGDDKCMYRHALPQGYVLKRDKKKDEDEDEISMEVLVEEERQALHRSLKPGEALTPVTEDTFKAWKRRKILEKKRAFNKEQKTKKQKVKMGKQGGLSGRELFALGSIEVGAGEDGDDGGDAVDLKAMRALDQGAGEAATDETDDSGSKSARTIDESLFTMDLGDLDDFSELEPETNDGADTNKPAAGGKPPAASASSTAGGAEVAGPTPPAPEAGGAVEVDASLFSAEDLGDLGDLDGLDDLEDS